MRIKPFVLLSLALFTTPVWAQAVPAAEGAPPAAPGASTPGESDPDGGAVTGPSDGGESPAEQPAEPVAAPPVEAPEVLPPPVAAPAPVQPAPAQPKPIRPLPTSKSAATGAPASAQSRQPMVAAPARPPAPPVAPVVQEDPTVSTVRDMLPTKLDFRSRISLQAQLGPGFNFDRGGMLQPMIKTLVFADLILLDQCKLKTTGVCGQVLVGLAVEAGRYLDSQVGFFGLQPLVAGGRVFFGDQRTVALTVHGALTGLRFNDIPPIASQQQNLGLVPPQYRSPGDRIMWSGFLRTGVDVNVGKFRPNDANAQGWLVNGAVELGNGTGAALAGRRGHSLDVTFLFGAGHTF